MLICLYNVAATKRNDILELNKNKLHKHLHTADVICNNIRFSVIFSHMIRFSFFLIRQFKLIVPY